MSAKSQALAARAAEHDPGRLDDRRARRRDEQVDRTRAGRRRADDQVAVGTARAAGDDRPPAPGRTRRRRATAAPPRLARSRPCGPYRKRRARAHGQCCSQACGPGMAWRTSSTGAGRRPVFAGSGAFLFWVMNHQTAREHDHDQEDDRPHHGKPLDLGAAGCARSAAPPAARGLRRLRRSGGAARPPAARRRRPSAAEPGQQAGRPESLRKVGWKRRGDRILLAAEQRRDRRGVGPVGGILLADRPDRRLDDRADRRLRRRLGRAGILAERPGEAGQARTAEQVAEQVRASGERRATSPPPSAPASFVRRSGSELETASTTFWAPPGAATAVPSAPRTTGMAAADKLLRRRLR